jgi:AcrR family transcriptional regulator
MTDTDSHDDGRVHQKRRTRSAILRAASDLLNAGALPSIAEAADAAQVSRATAYRYFSTQEHLLQELALDRAALTIDHVIATISTGGSAADRLDTVVHAVYQLVTDNDLAFRTLLRLSLEPKAAPESTADAPRRSGRRLRWLDVALAPIREQLGAAHYDHLLAALALCTGIETHIVLCDICALDKAEADRVTRWAAQALLRASLADALGECEARGKTLDEEGRLDPR